MQRIVRTQRTVRLHSKPRLNIAPGERLGASVRLAATFLVTGVLACGSGLDSDMLPVSQIAFQTHPAMGVGGTPLTVQPVVELLDVNGNRVPSSTLSVALTFEDNPGGATLMGTTTVSAAGGLATFTDIAVDVAASGYTLRATAPGGLSTTSAAFAVVFGPSSFITIMPDSGSVNIGSTIQFVGTARDAGGNAVPTDPIVGWGGSDLSVATPSVNGVFTGIGTGSITVTATSQSGLTGTAVLTVR